MYWHWQYCTSVFYGASGWRWGQSTGARNSLFRNPGCGWWGRAGQTERGWCSRSRWSCSSSWGNEEKEFLMTSGKCNFVSKTDSLEDQLVGGVGEALELYLADLSEGSSCSCQFPHLSSVKFWIPFMGKWTNHEILDQLTVSLNNTVWFWWRSWMPVQQHQFRFLAIAGKGPEVHVAGDVKVHSCRVPHHRVPKRQSCCVILSPQL